MSVASISTDRRLVSAATEMEFVIPDHPDGSTVVVAVAIEGNATPIAGLPVGWTQATAAYQAASGVTWVLWHYDALAELTGSVVVEWTGTRKAAGNLVVSPDSQGVSAVGAVTADATYTDVGTLADVTAAIDDLPLAFGATLDVNPYRLPDLTSFSSAMTDMSSTDDVQLGLDAWVAWDTSGVPAGATGAVTFDMLGTGVTSGNEPITSIGGDTATTGAAGVADDSLVLTLPVGAEVGHVALIAAGGAPPNSAVTTPAVSATALGSTASGFIVESTIATGHGGKLAIFNVAIEGDPGAVTFTTGWTPGPYWPGIGYTAYKRLDGSETFVRAASTIARRMRSQVIIVDGQLGGIKATVTAANIAQPYGPHNTPEQLAAASSLSLLTYVSNTDTATMTSTDDAHTVTNNAQPSGAVYETGYAVDSSGAANNPTGIATMAASTTALIVSWIIDPRPSNPTNLLAPVNSGAETWAEVYGLAGSGNAGSGYVWIKTLSTTDIADGFVTVYPSGTQGGEFAALLQVYSNVSSLDSGVSGATGYSATFSSTALATVYDNSLELVFGIFSDHGAPSHADSLVASHTLTGATLRRDGVNGTSGLGVALYEYARPTAGAGTARSGTAVNGLASEVQFIRVSFGLRAVEANGSRQTTQLVTLQETPDIGPNVVIQVPPATGYVGSPQVISGIATDRDNVTAVALEIVRNADGLWWNGATWVGALATVAATLGAGTTTRTWTYTATGVFVTVGSFTITVHATDGAAIVNTDATRTVHVAPPTVVARVREAKLGFGQDIMVEIIGRGGGPKAGQKVVELPVTTSGHFDRRLDATSEAKVSSLLSSRDLILCRDELATIETYAHELRIWWDGIVAWVGPITHIEFRRDGLDITASDLTVHWETRVIGGHKHDNVELATIFADYHRDAYQQDPWAMEVLVTPIGLQGSREVLPDQGMVASRALDELSRTGIDWTAVGRQLLIGGEEVPARPIATLSDEHFTQPLKVIDDGVNRATDVVVSGDGVSGRATLLASSDYRRRYGLITSRSQEQNIIDQASAQTAARTRLDFKTDPVRIDPGEGVLRPSAPLAMVDLIPGARIDLETSATIRRMAGKFRLSKVHASLDGTVKLTTQPLGTVRPGS